MKKTLFVLIFTGTGLCAQNVPATLSRSLSPRPAENFPVFDIYAVAPYNFNGAGFGMGGFSPALRTNSFGGGAELRIGGDFYFTTLDRRTIRNVPLLAPQTGAAKVKLNENMFALNAVARLSLPWTAKVTPYIDGFAGLRFTGAGITVTADQYQPGYEQSTSDNLDEAFAFQYGAAGGFLISLGKNVKLNTGVVFSRSDKPGSLSNIHSAGLQGSGLVMDKKALSPDVITFKLGLTFRITPGNRSESHNCQCCGASTRTVSRSPSFSSPRSGNRAPNRISIGGGVKK